MNENLFLYEEDLSEVVEVCAYCKAEIKEGEGYEGVTGTYCSEDCRREAEPDYVCEYCDDWNVNVNYVEDLDMRICDDCYDSYTTECDYCGRRIFLEDLVEGEEGDYCSYECRDEAEYGHSAYVNNYSYKPEPIFYCTEEEKIMNNKRYYGVEVELDTVDGCSKKATETEIHNRFCHEVYMKHDGSLSEGGVEIVSHPMTYNYHKNNMDWEKLLNIAVEGDLNSLCGCGFHIHVNNESFTNVTETKANLIKFFDKFWEEIVEASNRMTGEISDWASRPDKDVIMNYKDHDEDLVDRIKRDGRYQAVNLTNTATTEIRIFRSVDNFDDFMSDLTLVDNIVEICDTLKWKEIEKLSWETVLNYKNKTTESTQESVA